MQSNLVPSTSVHGSIISDLRLIYVVGPCASILGSRGLVMVDEGYEMVKHSSQKDMALLKKTWKTLKSK